MRKLLVLLLVLLMTPCALAETVLDPLADREIAIIPAGENETPDGVSPTTGRVLGRIIAPAGSEGLAVSGRYLPMLVQIGNDNGGVDDRAPWGITYADILYEMPLTRNHETRITAVFSDVIPDSVGFVRSARIGHVWLREEWDGGFLYYGQQEVEGSDVPGELHRLGADAKGLTFPGTAGGTRFKKYYTARKRLKSPYNMDANAAAMSRLIPEEHAAPNHAFRFTDEAPEGDEAKYVYVNWGSLAGAYNSRLVYRADWGGYIRSVGGDKSAWYADRDDDAGAIAFQNVIVQFTRVTYNHNKKAEPIAWVIGEDGAAICGNADYFMGGVHISGVWQRDAMTSRTVFYGPDGEEIALQRGRTLIIIFPDDGDAGKQISYE